jgi:hypothetical protein
MYGVRRIQSFGGSQPKPCIHLREGGHLKDPGIDGRIILKWIFKKWNGMDWIDLAQDRDRW